MSSIKYVTLFLVNFDTPLLSHFVTHPGTPQKVRYISEPPRIFSRPSTKNRTKAPVQILSQLFAEVFVRGLCQAVFCLEGFVRSSFRPFSLLSEYICDNRKLNITLKFMFHMYEIFL